MDAWASKYFGLASFICVSCDGPGLASTFAKRLQLSKCLLTYVDGRNGPTWGQLGCNGFILLDAQGNVACKQTSAYLEVQQLAFDDVESRLDSMLADGPPPALSPGQHVELHGLSKSELNGTRGYVVGAADASTGRIAVRTYLGKMIAVRPENLRGLEDGGGEEGAEGFDDVTGGCDAKKKAKTCDKQACDKRACGQQACDKSPRVDADAMPERMKRALEQPPAPPAPPKTEGVAPLAAIESVHVEALDAEHEECAAALARLAEAPTREAIEGVIAAYTEHFAHEEALLDEHLYTPEATAAGKAGGFSAAAGQRRSHFADHKRLLVDLQLRAAALPSGGPPTGPKAWIHIPGGEKPDVFVDKVLRSFEQHANVYDASYAAPLAAKLAEASA